MVYGDVPGEDSYQRWLFYAFTSTGVLELGKGSVHARKHTRGSEGGSTTLTLAAVPVGSQSDRLRVKIRKACPDYSE